MLGGLPTVTVYYTLCSSEEAKERLSKEPGVALPIYFLGEGTSSRYKPSPVHPPPALDTFQASAWLSTESLCALPGGAGRCRAVPSATERCRPLLPAGAGGLRRAGNRPPPGRSPRCPCQGRPGGEETAASFAGAVLSVPSYLLRREEGREAAQCGGGGGRGPGQDHPNSPGDAVKQQVCRELSSSISPEILTCAAVRSYPAFKRKIIARDTS